MELIILNLILLQNNRINYEENNDVISKYCNINCM